MDGGDNWSGVPLQSIPLLAGYHSWETFVEEMA